HPASSSAPHRLTTSSLPHSARHPLIHSFPTRRSSDLPSHRHRSDFDDRETDRSGDGYVDHSKDHGGEERTRSHHVLSSDVEAERDHEYDDFSPADYGMPERPQRGSRRRRSISEDFPGF